MKKESELLFSNDILQLIMRILKGSIVCGVALYVTENPFIGIMAFIIGCDGLSQFLKRNK